MLHHLSLFLLTVFVKKKKIKRFLNICWNKYYLYFYSAFRIEQQLRKDRTGATAPDCNTPFASTSDACKRLVRYHCLDEPLLSHRDLEKADEIFEATARHFLDKKTQMLNKYSYLLLMESMVRYFIFSSYHRTICFT